MIPVMIPALKRSLDDTEESFRLSVARQLNVDAGDIGRVRILRQAVDARKKEEVFFSVHCLVDLPSKAARRILADRKLHAQPYAPEKETPLVHGTAPLKGRVLVVGMGPGGLFAGWLLAREGYRPLVIDRGKAMEDRVRDVEAYWQTGRADPESNPLFGEGGAGTFSDGKLTARSKDPRCSMVLDAFLACGAPEEIGFLAKPHVGTDKLRQVVKSLRQQIVSLGGQVRFSTRLESIHTQDGAVSAVTLVHEGWAWPSARGPGTPTDTFSIAALPWPPSPLRWGSGRSIPRPLSTRANTDPLPVTPGWGRRTISSPARPRAGGSIPSACARGASWWAPGPGRGRWWSTA